MFNLGEEWTERDNKIIGQKFLNSSDLEFIVTNYYYNKEKNSKKMKIKFIKSGYEAFVDRHSIKKGAIVDRLSPTVAGVGILGLASMKNHKRIYYIWNSIINRCYNPNDATYGRYGKRGVTVCERWKRFDFFLEDFKKIEGYDEEKFLKSELALDKDIKQINLPINERIYSLKTCMFVSPKINSEYTSSTHEGIHITAFNKKENIKVDSKNISSFAKAYGLNRHSVSKFCNTGIEYKGWIIKKEIV